MKRLHIPSLSLLPLLFFSTFVLHSCQDIGETLHDNASLPTVIPEAEAGSNLAIIGHAVLRLSADPEFRNVVYREIEKQFDGDNNVLLETLLEPHLAAKMNNKTDATEFKNALNSFYENDGMKRYPQIYIPFYEELKEKKRSGDARILTPASAPIIVPYTGENETGQYEGFRLAGDGSLQKLDFLVNEEYARNHELWVISVNERVDGSGNVVYTVDQLESLPAPMESSTEVWYVYPPDLSSEFCDPPDVPQNAEVLPVLPYSLRVRWQDIQGVSFYKVFREVNYSGYYGEIATVYPEQGSIFLDPGLSVGTHYDYQVQAFNALECFSARSYGAGAYASWRTNNFNEVLHQIFISDVCWNWCCSWPEGKIELMYRIVKYNKTDKQVEYPKNALPQTSKSDQKGVWCTYDKELFRWDIEKYAYNYLLFFYEDDGGDDKGTTIKLSASFKPLDKVNVGIDVSFTIDDRDEELGWIEIYHFDPAGKIYNLAPRKGYASIKIRQ